MRQQLAILKSIVLIGAIMFLSNVVFGQTTMDGGNRLNLPPGMLLHPKFQATDYSYKLDYISTTVPSSYVEKNFLQEFSDADLQSMKETSLEKYQYYMNANEFYTKLSPRVKATFSVEELWHVYMFDQQLTNKLLTIK